MKPSIMLFQTDGFNFYSFIETFVKPRIQNFSNRMVKIQLFTWLFAALTLVTSALAKKKQVRQEANPNIILILADDQGWGSTSVKMDKDNNESSSDFIRTPNLERLASKGVIFSNGYSSHPNCSPTRASIQTGKTPAKLHMTDIIERHSGKFYEGNKLVPPRHVNGLSSKEVTISEIIKSNRPEYKTAHFGKWHLGNGGPENHGYDKSDGETSNSEGNLKNYDNPKDIYGITTRSVKWMKEQVSEGRPFFMQISHYATHLGFEAREETVKQIKKRPPGHRHQTINFAAMAENLDDGIGMILNEVQKLKIDDNTYIIYLADNGTYPTSNSENVNGPLHGWKASLWEGGIRVPFIISGPGIKQAYSSTPVVSHDLFPTICEWLDIKKLPEGLEGGSLVHQLKQPESDIKVERQNDYLVFHFPHYQLEKGSQPSSVIIKGDYKLMNLYEDNRYLLFNLKKDTNETQDLAEIQPKKLNELKGLLSSYLSSINAGLPLENVDYDIATDPGLKNRLIKERILKEAYFIPK